MQWELIEILIFIKLRITMWIFTKLFKLNYSTSNLAPRNLNVQSANKLDKGKKIKQKRLKIIRQIEWI